jgi:glycosyltransferase involved in cell wall biosynthesis
LGLNILIITYYWPPSGGPAVQRWLTFSNLLAEKGIKLFILTVEEESANYPAIDYSLESRVSPLVKVYKTKTSEIFWLYKKFIGKGKAPSAGFANESKPGLLQNLARFIRGNFFIPDPRKSWNKYALQKAREIIGSENINIIITAGPPHSTHLIGLELQKEFGLKWIADFHDAWTDVWYYDKLMHTALAAAIDKSLEKKVLEKADKVLTVGKLLKSTLEAKSSKINNSKIEVISMGYDEKEFIMASTPPGDAFVITYTGTIDDSYEPTVFFRALNSIKNKHADITYKLRFVGILAEGVLKQVKGLGLQDNLEEIGYVPHERSIEFLLNSTVLLLVSPKVKSEEIIIPGKIYEYLASGKPIINIGSLKCDSGRIITECEAGANFDRSMEDQLTHYLDGLSLQWKENHNLDLKNSNKNYTKYSRSYEAGTLLNIITELTDVG